MDKQIGGLLRSLTTSHDFPSLLQTIQPCPPPVLHSWPSVGFAAFFFPPPPPSLLSYPPIEDRSYRVGAIFVRCKLFGSGRATLATLNLVKISG